MSPLEPHPPEGEHKADRRVREVYRYFQPTNPAALNPTWLPFGAEVSANTTPLHLPTDPSDEVGLDNLAAAATAAVGPVDLNSPNTTLTAFAQLVALRLNARRALISVLDRESQYILAEATQSLNLADPTSFIQSSDGLWAGCSKVAQAWNVCKDTVTLRRDKQAGRRQLLIVNDLSAHDRYKRLPFVQGEPHFRFYAGTPLTTANGLNIGCIFVLDSEPREHGLTDVDQDHLGTVAALVMDYLRVSRQASEGRRAARLSRGLSCFVDGSSSFVDSANPSRASSSTPGTSAAALSTTPPSVTQRTNLSSAHSRTSPRGARRSPASRQSSVDSDEGVAVASVRSQSADDASVVSSSTSEGKGFGSAGTASDLTTPLPDWWMDPNGKGVPLDDINSNLWAFRRAANLLRESLELDGDGGVIFMEASNGPTLDGDNDSVYTGEISNPAAVLAVSTNDEPFAPHPGSRASHPTSYSRCPAASLDRAFLQQLFRRYPKGKLWSFHRDGSVATSDEDEKSSGPPPGASRPIDVSRGTTRKWRASENSLLNAYFPHASQVMFVPMWNAASSRWYAGCFCWTSVETHVFSSAVELSALLGFASSVMAECSRVESLIADRQKGDFIGSISHELRSPLHGILAAAEFLDSTALNEFQTSLLETINACGRTLLDTMNQVLDFSKIVSLERSWRQLKRNKEMAPLGDLKSIDKVSAHLDTYTWTDLAVLAEEVVEGVCLGHSYGQRSTPSGDQFGPAGLMSPQLGASGSETSDASGRNEVEVVVDIVHQDWVYKTQPGALRRIIMNVFGNAMKYTDKGRVSIRLESVERSEGRSRRQGLQDLVTLTITDTGKGISEEFLRRRLYTPFAQEDTLAAGTGLGLSIVRSIVKALNGSISIHSRPGEGTMVKVSLPLVRPAGEDSPPLTPHAELLQQRDASVHALHLREAFRGRRVAILGYHPDSAGDAPSWPVVAQYLTDWYELELVPWPVADGTLDLLLADENDLTPGVVLNGIPSTSSATAAAAAAAPPLPALLIFCHKSIDYSSACSGWSSLARTVEILRRPCGPYKLAKSILKCLRGGTSTATASRSTSPGQALTDLPRRPRGETPTPTATVDAPSLSPHLSVPPTSAPLSQLAMSDSHSGSDSSLPTLDLTRSMSGTPHSSISSVSTNVTQPSAGSTAETTSRKPRVLVVDDNSINRHLMLTFMRKRNLDVLDSAENGKLAVDAVERMQQGYDLIFMDMSMPVMNGFEATRAIRSREKDSGGRDRATIIALTGLSSSRDASEALASGVDLFLTKPVSFKEVSRLLDEWQEKHQQQKQHCRAAATAASAGAATTARAGSTASTTPPSEPLPSPEEEVEEELG